MFFWIRVEKFMLSVRLVLEICGLKVVASFNFALSAPHVKRRIKSCEPSAVAATYVDAMSLKQPYVDYSWIVWQPYVDLPQFSTNMNQFCLITSIYTPLVYIIINLYI